MLSAAPLLNTAPARAERPYVLLVDDHAPSLCLLSKVVENAGYACMAAGSATEAIACVEARRPQVVVTDLSMPNLDGSGLARWLKLRFPSMPLLLLTGQDLDSAALTTLGRTFTAVLSKPLDAPWLLGWLDRLMPAARTGDPTLTSPPGWPYDAGVRVTRGVAQPG